MPPTIAQISRHQLESKLNDLMAEDSYWKPSHPDHRRVREIAALGFLLLHPTPSKDQKEGSERSGWPSLFHDGDEGQKPETHDIFKYREIMSLLDAHGDGQDRADFGEANDNGPHDGKPGNEPSEGQGPPYVLPLPPEKNPPGAILKNLENFFNWNRERQSQSPPKDSWSPLGPPTSSRCRG